MSSTIPKYLDMDELYRARERWRADGGPELRGESRHR